MICVFDKFTDQNQFDTCGERILNPTSAYITQEFNGNYYYEITAPMLPEDDSWQYIVPHNIIKASNGQLFPISKISQNIVNGVPTVTAYAPHIWYYLSDKIVESAEINQFSCYWAIDYIHKNTRWNRDPNCVDYDFRYGSDIGDLQYTKFENVSYAYAILGSPDSIVNIYGGELYRNNFEFSVNRRMQNSDDHSFALVYGWNCTDVKRTLDYTDYITAIRMYDNINQSYSAIKGTGNRSFPHHVEVVKRSSYKDDDENLSNLRRDADRYWAEFAEIPRLTYEVAYTDLNGTKTPGWDGLQYVRVGDKGTVMDITGRTDTNMVISTKYNDLTGRNENVKLGNFRPSDMHISRWDKVMSGDSAAFRRLDVIESKENLFRVGEVEEQ